MAAILGEAGSLWIPRCTLETTFFYQIEVTPIADETQHRHRGMLLFQEASQNQGKYFTQTNWHCCDRLINWASKTGNQSRDISSPRSLHDRTQYYWRYA